MNGATNMLMNWQKMCTSMGPIQIIKGSGMILSLPLFEGLKTPGPTVDHQDEGRQPGRIHRQVQVASTKSQKRSV